MLSTTLDALISTAAVMLALSLLASVIQELIAQVLDLRARSLKTGIAQLLADPSIARLIAPLYAHPLIRGLAAGKCDPSYIPAARFASALIDVMQSSGGLSQQTPGAVGALMRQTGGDIDKFRTELEGWYDDAMDRVSGAYKRLSTYMLLLIGLVLAAAWNIDLIRVVSDLSVPSPLQQALVSRAADIVKVGPPAQPAAKPELSQGEETKPIPSAANSAASPSASTSTPEGANNKDVNDLREALADAARYYDTIAEFRRLGLHIGRGPGEPFFPDPKGILGWLLTALGVSLGARFWFNALENLLKIRNTGPKPPKAEVT